MLPRFNYIARNIDEALIYYQNRATQLISQGWSWDGTYQDLGWGIHVYLVRNGIPYDSVYVLQKSAGHLTKWFQEQERNFVTMAGCQAMYEWLCKKEFPYTLAMSYDSESYRKISVFYGDRRAQRTNVFYMNHIDEGLYILKKLEASRAVWDAYCLHPIYQLDDDLKKLWDNNAWKDSLHKGDASRLIILAMEYRNIANAYLSKRNISSLEEINLSPIEEVNVMLRADKIQNRKDFEKYHLEKHPESERLQKYFQNWFDRLEITEEFYQECVKEINEKTGMMKRGAEK